MHEFGPHRLITTDTQPRNQHQRLQQAAQSTHGKDGEALCSPLDGNANPTPTQSQWCLPTTRREAARPARPPKAQSQERSGRRQVHRAARSDSTRLRRVVLVVTTATMWRGWVVRCAPPVRCLSRELGGRGHACTQGARACVQDACMHARRIHVGSTWLRGRRPFLPKVTHGVRGESIAHRSIKFENLRKRGSHQPRPCKS